MFKFDFKVDAEKENHFGDEITNKENIETIQEVIEWYDSQEILPKTDTLENLDVFKLNSTSLTIGNVSLTYVVSGFLLQDVIENDNTNQDLKKAEENHSDLIPGVYEGGAKIWECTEDVLKYMSDNYDKFDLNGKRVLDLGCGSGLLGIYAYKCGAKVVFQDYNTDVLEKITIPNILLNVPKPPKESDLDLNKLRDDVRLYSGDWSKYAQLTKDDEHFDIILTSETIYNPDNQAKLLDTLHAKLKPSGVVLVAAKTHYFGVGGGLRQFEELICNDKRFHSKVLWTAKMGVGREIVELKYV